MENMTLNEQLVWEINELEMLLAMNIHSMSVEAKLQRVYELIEMCIQFETMSNADIVNTMMVVDELDDNFDRLRERYYI